MAKALRCGGSAPCCLLSAVTIGGEASVLRTVFKHTRRLTILSLALCALIPAARAADSLPPMPQYKIDTSWPKLPLPNNWTFGLIGGIFVDSRDHVYIY